MDQQPPVPPQPQQPQQPQPVPVAPQGPMQQPVPPAGVPVENPGQTLGIIGLVCNFLGVGLGGIILGVMSRNKSKQYNMSTTLGTVSLVWGIIITVFVVLWFIFAIFVGIMGAASGSTSSSTSTSDSSSLYSTDN